MMKESTTTQHLAKPNSIMNPPSGHSTFPLFDFLIRQSENSLTEIFQVKIKIAMLKNSTNTKSLQGQEDAFIPFLTIRVRLKGMTDEISILLEKPVLQLFQNYSKREKGRENFIERDVFPVVRHCANRFFYELAEKLRENTEFMPEIQSIRLMLYKPMGRACHSSCLRSTDIIMTVLDGSSSHVLRCVYKVPVADLLKAPVESGSETGAENSQIQHHMNQFIPVGLNTGQASPNLESLLNLELPVAVELGRIRMFVKDIIDLSPGSLVQIDKLTGETVDLFVNEKKIAEGEVVINARNVGVKITALVGKDERFFNIDERIHRGR